MVSKTNKILKNVTMFAMTVGSTKVRFFLSYTCLDLKML